MDIGIVTIAYNDYGKFVPQWCKSISELSIKPSKSTVVLGRDHRFTKYHHAEALEYLPNLNIIEHKSIPNMGKLRNVAVINTETEWIQYLSVDDIILPWAIEEYKKFEEKADYIVIKWQSIATWEVDPPVFEHLPRLPVEMALNHRGKGFINNQSPYRRSFWHRRRYQEHDFPNAPFLADMVEQGARFVRTERPCTMYLRRLDSHCGKNLGRRNKKANPRLKAIAKRHKKRAEERIVRYYNDWD